MKWLWGCWGRIAVVVEDEGVRLWGCGCCRSRGKVRGGVVVISVLKRL